MPLTVISVDPSGNTGSEGNGTTGIARFYDGVVVDFCHVKAEAYDTPEAYWAAVSDKVSGYDTLCGRVDAVVCESYKLFAHKAQQQSWSAMETPQLIGAIRVCLWQRGIPVYFQDPSSKVRVTDPILEHMGVIEKKGQFYHCQQHRTNIHERDAIRHGVFFHNFGKGKELLASGRTRT